jgi:hypothetical protein
MVEQCHVHRDKPLHLSITHKILNDPNPDAHPVGFPDGSAAKLILLGDEIPLIDIGSPTWWPTAISDKVRSKLFRRLIRQGYVLPILMSVCLALLAEMYTTDAVPASASPDGKAKRRTRLRHKTSPIADFGIAYGSADVKNQDKFAYLNVADMSFFKGQDPDDHYWLYFTTIAGQDILLDCAMFTFNMCLMVPAEPYLPGPLIVHAPAFFRDRVIDRNTPKLHKEIRRASVLRDPDLHKAVANSANRLTTPDVNHIISFMERLSKRTITQIEKDLMITFTLANFEVLAQNLRHEDWKQYPSSVPIQIETDPGEMDVDAINGRSDEDWSKFMKKWKHLYKKDASKEALHKAFEEYARGA